MFAQLFTCIRAMASRSRSGLELSLEAPDVLKRAVKAQALRPFLQTLAGDASREVQEGGQVAVELGVRDGVLMLSITVTL